MRFTTALTLLLTGATSLAMPAASPATGTEVLDPRAAAGACRCKCLDDCRIRCFVQATPGSAVGAGFCISGCYREECGCADDSTSCT